LGYSPIIFQTHRNYLLNWSHVRLGGGGTEKGFPRELFTRK
jgi:hypothetical protein